MANPSSRKRLEAIEARLGQEGYRLSEAVQLQARGLYVHVDERADTALTPGLLETGIRHWRRLAPLHRWLVDHLQAPHVTD